MSTVTQSGTRSSGKRVGALILAIVGIMVGMIQGNRTQTNGIGADLIVRPPNQSFLVGVSGAPAPAKIADVLRKLPHVAV